MNPALHHSTSARRLAATGALLGLLAGVIASAPSAAAVEGGLLSTTLTAIQAAVPAGDSLSYSLNVQCSNPGGCGTVTSTIPAPAAWDPADGAPVVNLSPADITAGVSFTATGDGTLTVTWPRAAPGNTVNVQLNWPTRNYLTLPGQQSVTVTASDTAGDAGTAAAANRVTAEPNLRSPKYGPSVAQAGATVTYSILASNVQTNPTESAGGLALTDVVVTDLLPAGVSNVVANNGGVYDPVTHTVTWPAIASLAGGPVGAGRDVVSYILPTTGAPGAGYTDVSTTTGTPLGGGAPVTVTSSVTTRTTTGPETVGPQLTKLGPGSVSPGDTVLYVINAGNTSNVATYVSVDDPIPSGLSPITASIWDTANDRPYTGGGSFTVSYSDGTTGKWVISEPAQLNPDHKQITDLTIVIADEDPGTSLAISVTATVSATQAIGSTIVNCATETVSDDPGSPTSVGDPGCTSAVVVAQLSNGSLRKSLTEITPVAIGGTLHWNLFVSGDASGRFLTEVQPRIVDLIPTQLTYVAGSFALAAGQLPSCPTASRYVITLTADYLNGRTALIAVAVPGATVAENVTCQYTYRTTVNPGVPSQTFGGTPAGGVTDVSFPINSDYAGNDAYLFDARGIMSSSFHPGDSSDIDHDGDRDEGVSSSTADFAVSQSAALHVVKRVKGDQDGAFLGSAELDPTQVATSTVGGTVTYQIELGDDGNESETNAVAYDLLPQPDNHGVTVSRYGDTSDDNQWVPKMTGPVDTGTDPLTVYYSTSADPCRPEMDNTHTEPFYCGGSFNARGEWAVAADVSDWSTVKAIRFDAGPTVVPPHAAATYTWTMTVPSARPDGTPFTGGESTWNKVAIYAESVVGGVLTPLLPTEAPWVKVRVFVPVASVQPSPVVPTVATPTVLASTGADSAGLLALASGLLTAGALVLLATGLLGRRRRLAG